MRRASGLRRRPQAPADYQPAQRQALAAAAGLAEHVAELELALDDFENRGVAGRADRQLAEILAMERPCRGGGAGADHRPQFDPEGEEFRHRHELVEGGAVDAERMDVAADDVGQEAGFEHQFGGAEPERAAAMADVEDDAAAAGLQHLLADAAVGP